MSHVHCSIQVSARAEVIFRGSVPAWMIGAYRVYCGRVTAWMICALSGILGWCFRTCTFFIRTNWVSVLERMIRALSGSSGVAGARVDDSRVIRIILVHPGMGIAALSCQSGVAFQNG